MSCIKENKMATFNLRRFTNDDDEKNVQFFTSSKPINFTLSKMCSLDCSSARAHSEWLNVKNM